MSLWVNRTVLSGSSVSQNGTNSHTCTFTAATAGNLLVAVVAASVTCTTPSGWTLQESAINYSALYVFTKTASSGESSFSTTHNDSNYPMKGVIYEYPAGTTYLNDNSETNQANNSTETGPQVTGLTGTYTRFSARSWDLVSASGSVVSSWTVPGIQDYDSYVAVSPPEGGVFLGIAYDDNATGSSFNPSSLITVTNTGGVSTGEGVSFALSVAFSATSVSWII